MDGSAWSQGDGAIITPSFAYGFSACDGGNLYHLEGQKLLYPAGQFFAVIGAEDGKASFIPTSNSVQVVRGLRVASNKRYLAAVEDTYDSDQQQVSVYNIPAEKRMRTLTLEKQYTHANTVAAVSFSGDAKLLMVVAGEPDYTIFLWRWSSNKLVMTIKPECEVQSAMLNPWDETYLAIASKHMARSYKMDLEGSAVKPSSIIHLDDKGYVEITCILYLVGGLLAVGTSSGAITIHSDVGVVSTLDISTAESVSVRLQQGTVSPPRGSMAGQPQQAWSWSGVAPKAETPSVSRNAVQCMVQRGRGFVAAGSRWDIYLFDPPAASTKKEGGIMETYTLAQRLSFASALSSIPASPPNLSLSASGGSNSSKEDELTSADARILGLSVSVTDDHIALTTAAGRLLLLDLTAALQALEDAHEAAAAVSVVATHDHSKSGQVANQPGGSPSVAADGGKSSSSGSRTASESGPLAVDAEQDEAEPNPTGWQVLCSGFPSARVVGLDASVHLPLLLVVSEDKWVRIWDWVRRTRLAARHFPDEQLLCCALHPSGVMMALGTSEGLKLYYILRREVALITDLPVAKCSVVRYSHGGGLLAAVGRSNAIIVYPAYYGGGAGASGVSPSQWHCSGQYSQTSQNGAHRAGAVAEPAAVGHEGAYLMRPKFVLKAHVSTVTDLAFSGDDKRLISTGAGGAVYFWDMTTGTRLMELEYVDKKCVYYAACHHDRHDAAVVRTLDGRLQHLQGGQLVYEVSGLGSDASPVALTADGRVLLAGTCRGSVISIPWPKDPEAAGLQQTQAAINDAEPNSMGGFAAMQPIHAQGTKHSDTAGIAAAANAQQQNLHVGLVKHLTAQVESGGPGSPRGGAVVSDSTTPKMPAKLSTFGQQQGQLKHNKQPEQQQQSHNHTDQRPSQATANNEGGGGTGSHQGFKEFRMHSARITAIKVLHTAGVMFTASTDGLVMMGSISLVLEGLMTEPPTVALPPSAVVTSATAAAAAQLAMGPNSSLTATGLAAGLGAVVVPGAVPGLPLPVVVVDEGFVLALKERIRGMGLQVVAARKEAQYQVLRQTQALRESLGLSETQAAALQKEVDSLQAALAENQAAADLAQEQAMKQLEALHVAAAEQLEGLYEARLALESERLAQLAAAKDDLEFSLKEEMKRRSTEAEQLLEEVHAMYKKQLAEQAATAEGAAAAAAENAAMWEEVLMQTEEDMEQQAGRDSEKLAHAEHQAGEVMMKLKAEINILDRKNTRLRGEKAEDTAKIDDLSKQVSNLNTKLVEAAAGADKLRRELSERDGVIAETYQTLQGLRRRVQELETHKFVLTYKADVAAAELQPKEEQITTMQQTLAAQDRELITGHTALLAAQRAVADKNVAVVSVKQELWEARQTIRHQAGLLDAVAHDVYNVLQQSDERIAGGKPARQQALDALAIKYCTNRGGGPRSTVQVEQEMLAHIAAAEKKSKLLEGQLKQALDAKKRNSRYLMADNTALLADIAELAHMNRNLETQLSAATSQLAQVERHFAAVDGTCRRQPHNCTEAHAPNSCMEGDHAVPAVCPHPSTAADHTVVPITEAARSASPLPSSSSPAKANHVGAQQQSPAAVNRDSCSTAAYHRTNHQAGSSPRAQGGSNLPGPVGKLLPSSVGRVMSTALKQQQTQLDELRSLLAATARVVASQASHIQRLQDKAAYGQQQAAPHSWQSAKPQGLEAAEGDAAATRMREAAVVESNRADGSIKLAKGIAAMCDLRAPKGTATAGPSCANLSNMQGSKPPGHSGLVRPATADPHGSLGLSNAAAVCLNGSKPRPGSTGRCRPSTAGAIPKAMGQVSHIGHFSDARHSHAAKSTGRPRTAGAVGLMTSLKSDLEAWRAK